jgi:hypothetical protein
MVDPHCHICYTTNVEPDIMVCDRCGEVYCEDCSYTFTIHYQHQGARCFWCSEQKRLKPLTKETIRDNKLKLFLEK